MRSSPYNPWELSLILPLCHPTPHLEAFTATAATKKGSEEDDSRHVVFEQQSRMLGGTGGKLSQAECLDFSLKNMYLIKVKGIMRWKATKGFGLSFNLLSSRRSNENTFERISTPAFQHLRSYFIQTLHYIRYPDSSVTITTKNIGDDGKTIFFYRC